MDERAPSRSRPVRIAGLSADRAGGRLSTPGRDRLAACKPEQRRLAGLLVHDERAGHARVPTGPSSLRTLRFPEELHRSRGRLAYVRRQSHRPGGQRRPGKSQLDDRYRCACDLDHEQAERPEQRQLPELRIHDQRACGSRVRPGRRRLRSLQFPPDICRRRRRAAHLRCSCQGRRGQHRACGHIRLDDRLGRRRSATITQKPSDPSNDSSPPFAFSAGEPAQFQCKLDAAVFAACGSPKNYSGLGDGLHTFVVRATDSAGNVGPEASYQWTVDTVGPTTSITQKPGNPSNDSSPTFAFTASEPGAVRVQARRRRFRVLHVAADLQRACRRPAHDLGQGNRRCRQHRRPGDVRLDDRHDGTRDRDHGQADRPEQRQLAELLVHLERGRQQLCLQVGQRCVRGLRLAKDVQRGRAGLAHVLRPSDGCRCEHRCRRDLHLDDRHDRADDRDHAEAGQPEQRHLSKLRVHGERGGEPVCVSSRRWKLRALRLRQELHRSWRRLSYLLSPGHRPCRESRGRDELHLGDRHRRADRHDHRQAE